MYMLSKLNVMLGENMLDTLASKRTKMNGRGSTRAEQSEAREKY